MSTKRSQKNNQNSISASNSTSTCPECAFQNFTTFATDSVVRLSTDAFSINDKALIALEYTECFLVLFYTENAESKKLAKIWSVVAQQTPGPIFAGCNVLLEKKVAQAFAKVRASPSHPFKPYALHGWPVIIVYREGYPTAVYNGSLEVQSISDWAVTLACSANYFEPEQVFGGIEGQNLLEMQAPTPYINEPGKPPVRRTNSSQFTSGKGIRGTNPNIPLAPEGTKADESATKAAREQGAENLGYKLSPTQAGANLGPSPTNKTPQQLQKDIDFNQPSETEGKETDEDETDEEGKETDEEGKETDEEETDEEGKETDEEETDEEGKETDEEGETDKEGETDEEEKTETDEEEG